MKTAHLVFPHQLFEHSPLFKEEAPVYLIEEFLFFKQYPFHKQKLAYHRASMKVYADYLTSQKKEVVYVDATDEQSDIRVLIPSLKEAGLERLCYIDVADYWLEKRIESAAQIQGLETEQLDSPSFLLNRTELKDFLSPKRKILPNLLLQGAAQKKEPPFGSQWGSCGRQMDL